MKMLKLRKIQSMIVAMVVSGAVLTGCTGQTEEAELSQLNIFAAASLTNALEEIEKNFENNNSEIDLILNFGSSGSLQKQIQQGAPADVFFSASKKKLESVIETGEIEADDVVELLKNNLVVITPFTLDYLPTKLEDLSSKYIRKVSIAAPESAPAGRYAKESLEKSGLFETLKDKMVYGKDVRQTLNYVETGEVEAGIVYSSDAVVLDGGSIAFEIPEEMHSEIVYPVATLKDSPNKELAQRFVDYLQEKESEEIFVKYGFKVKED
jgi:molybdate transport system substrate-binding protein